MWSSGHHGSRGNFHQIGFGKSAPASERKHVQVSVSSSSPPLPSVRLFTKRLALGDTRMQPERATFRLYFLHLKAVMDYNACIRQAVAHGSQRNFYSLRQISSPLQPECWFWQCAALFCSQKNVFSKRCAPLSSQARLYIMLVIVVRVVGTVRSISAYKWVEETGTSTIQSVSFPFHSFHWTAAEQRRSPSI